jgi:hypothetical protein
VIFKTGTLVKRNRFAAFSFEILFAFFAHFAFLPAGYFTACGLIGVKFSE